MSNVTQHQLDERLADDRGGRVIFVSHCLLNENTRHLGGAFRRGGVDELVDGFQQEGLGIVQMRRPEQCAWDGVRKRRILWVYGASARWPLLSRLFPVLLPTFRRYTCWRYRWLARGVAREIADYSRSGYQVVGVVGVGGSPSCGVWTTLDMARSLQVIANCPLVQLDRHDLNDDAIVARRTEGAGLLVAALQQCLQKLTSPSSGTNTTCSMRSEVGRLACRRAMANLDSWVVEDDQWPHASMSLIRAIAT